MISTIRKDESGWKDDDGQHDGLVQIRPVEHAAGVSAGVACGTSISVAAARVAGVGAVHRGARAVLPSFGRFRGFSCRPPDADSDLRERCTRRTSITRARAPTGPSSHATTSSTASTTSPRETSGITWRITIARACTGPVCPRFTPLSNRKFRPLLRSADLPDTLGDLAKALVSSMRNS